MMKRRSYLAGVIVAVLLIFAVAFAQTNKKITDLNALTTPTSDDLLLVVDSPASLAETKKITFANFQAALRIPAVNITGTFGGSAMTNEGLWLGVVGSAVTVLGGADSTIGSPTTTQTAATIFKTYRSGNVTALPYGWYLEKTAGGGDTYGPYSIVKDTRDYISLAAGDYNNHGIRTRLEVNGTNWQSGQHIFAYGHWQETLRNSGNVSIYSHYNDCINNSGVDAASLETADHTTVAYHAGGRGNAKNSIAYNIVADPGAQFARGLNVSADSIYLSAIELFNATFTLTGTFTSNGTTTVTGTGSKCASELQAGDRLIFNGALIRVASAPGGNGSFTATANVGAASGQTVTKTVVPMRMARGSAIQTMKWDNVTWMNLIGSDSFDSTTLFSDVGINFRNDNSSTTYLAVTPGVLNVNLYQTFAGYVSTAAPSDTLANGYRIVTFDGGTNVRYGIGIESGYQWYLAGNNAGHKFYVNGSTAPTLALTVNPTANVKIAGTAVRATTEGTNHLDIFDGTAPVGTLANGISLYSSAGGLRVMNAAGNVVTFLAVSGNVVTTGDTGTVTNTMLAGSIAYSKLSLTGAILNADLAGSIAYSKLSLAGAILNADLAGSIAASKLVGTDIATVGTITAGVWNGTIITSGFGGTGNGFTKFSGPASSEKTFTLPNASATILTSNAAVTVAQGGTGIAVGVSGGITYFSSTTTIGSSALLTTNALILGGGAGAAPGALASLGTTVTVLHGNAAGAPSFAAVSLTADVSGILPGANGGTGNGFFAVSGPTTSLKTKAFSDASDTVAEYAVANVFTAQQAIRIADSNNSTVVRPVVIRHTGAAQANSMGVGASFELNYNSGVYEAGRLDFIETDVTDGSSAFAVSVNKSGTGMTKFLEINTTGLISFYRGANVASAATITPSGFSFHVTGATNITAISGTGVNTGTEITIIFDSNPLLTNGANLQLAGTINVTPTAGSVMKFHYDGSSVWKEITRMIR